MSNPTIIDVEVDEVITDSPQKSSQHKQPSTKPTQKTREFTESMQQHGDSAGTRGFSDFFGSASPHSASQGKGSHPFTHFQNQLGWKYKFLAKFLSALGRNKGRFRSKLWLPVWILLGVFVLVFMAVVAIISALLLLLRAVFRPYTDLVTRKN